MLSLFNWKNDGRGCVHPGIVKRKRKKRITERNAGGIQEGCRIAGALSAEPASLVRASLSQGKSALSASARLIYRRLWELFKFRKKDLALSGNQLNTLLV